MISRRATEKLQELASYFKVVAVVGPRQSGKTTLVRSIFPHKPYVSLEDPDQRRFALEDARGFLSEFPEGAILDEVQRTPDLFSYLQGVVDSSPQPGQFILTGSNNFLLQQSITQSLAGRVGYLQLLPFSLTELYPEKAGIPSEDELMIKGGYPPLFEPGIPMDLWFPNYLRTYIERDVRQIKNITDLIVFERFIRLLAGRVGQELNMTSLGNEVGVDTKTIQSWIGILESSFLIYLLRPHFQNFNKIIVKRPKIYFLDTGLVCFLLGISTVAQMDFHPLRGALFENLVVSELIKERTNQAKEINLFFWRDKTGHEIDVLIDEGLDLFPMEIKSGKTINSDYFKNLRFWMNLSQKKMGTLLYAGTQPQSRSEGITIMNWKEYFFRR
ncbi:ATP-binding protein [Algoriphagus sp.]|uniref:ATP-binding protein n=1 Tax=Algoriphagus sp. TaxID=1872435 RepID=UPI0027200EF3|nr:ATP-binding protein [Algoriphagus sp.]MDO8965421.1 ATP-binding protein [Algoriphagus sp.]MDP3201460.1 ATP-binding protein [Algoriphagus sp.]